MIDRNDLSVMFYNTTSETIPGFAVMSAVGSQTGGNWSNSPIVDGRHVLSMAQPRTTYDRFYYVNGPQPVLAGCYGTCTSGFHGLVLWNDEVNWNAGDVCGPKPGDWGLWRRRPGFTIMGGHDLSVGEFTGGHVLVRQHEVNQVIGRARSGFGSGGTDYVDLYWNGASLGFEILIEDQLLPGDKHISAGDVVVASFVNNYWVLTSSSATFS